MKQFEIYHLDRVEHRNNPLVLEITKTNRPLDQSIVQTYTSSKSHELKITDEFKPVSAVQFIKNKCIAVKAAYEEGLFTHVANVNAKTIDKAIVATNNINGYWFMKRMKGVDVINTPNRSTQSYDLVVVDGALFFVNTVGYFDVEAECILKYDHKGIQIKPNA